MPSLWFYCTSKVQKHESTEIFYVTDFKDTNFQSIIISQEYNCFLLSFVFFNPVVLKVWSLDQQQHHRHLGTQKCKLSGPIPGNSETLGGDQQSVF